MGQVFREAWLWKALLKCPGDEQVGDVLRQAQVLNFNNKAVDGKFYWCLLSDGFNLIECCLDAEAVLTSVGDPSSRSTQPLEGCIVNCQRARFKLNETCNAFIVVLSEFDLLGAGAGKHKDPQDIHRRPEVKSALLEIMESEGVVSMTQQQQLDNTDVYAYDGGLSQMASQSQGGDMASPQGNFQEAEEDLEMRDESEEEAEEEAAGEGEKEAKGESGEEAAVAEQETQEDNEEIVGVASRDNGTGGKGAQAPYSQAFESQLQGMMPYTQAFDSQTQGAESQQAESSQCEESNAAHENPVEEAAESQPPLTQAFSQSQTQAFSQRMSQSQGGAEGPDSAVYDQSESESQAGPRGEKAESLGKKRMRGSSLADSRPRVKVSWEDETDADASMRQEGYGDGAEEGDGEEEEVAEGEVGDSVMVDDHDHDHDEEKEEEEEEEEEEIQKKVVKRPKLPPAPRPLPKLTAAFSNSGSSSKADPTRSSPPAQAIKTSKDDDVPMTPPTASKSSESSQSQHSQQSEPVRVSDGDDGIVKRDMNLKQEGDVEIIEIGCKREDGVNAELVSKQEGLKEGKEEEEEEEEEEEICKPVPSTPPKLSPSAQASINELRRVVNFIRLEKSRLSPEEQARTCSARMQKLDLEMIRDHKAEWKLPSLDEEVQGLRKGAYKRALADKRARDLAAQCGESELNALHILGTLSASVKGQPELGSGEPGSDPAGHGAATGGDEESAIALSDSSPDKAAANTLACLN